MSLKGQQVTRVFYNNKLVSDLKQQVLGLEIFFFATVRTCFTAKCAETRSKCSLLGNYSCKCRANNTSRAPSTKLNILQLSIYWFMEKVASLVPQLLNCPCTQTVRVHAMCWEFVHIQVSSWSHTEPYNMHWTTLNHTIYMCQTLELLSQGRAQYNRSKVAGHCVRSETKMSDPCVRMSVHWP